MTKPRPVSSKRYAHHRDRAPDCPECETNIWVGADRGRDGERRCYRCGWTSAFDADDVEEPPESPARARPRVSPSDNPHGGCPTDWFDTGEPQDGETIDDVLQTPGAYDGDTGEVGE
jgi:hypothetical protein